MKLSGFKFLTDENIPPELIQFFRHSNFDVISVLSEGLIGHSDEDVCALAFKEGRVIITQDQDFGKLIYTSDVNYIGIIYLRPGHFYPEFHIETLKKIFEENPSPLEPFIIVGENTGSKIKIRIRNSVRKPDP
jgi:predicted nuclease of predicted toxin-antitoxin system